MLKKFFSFLSQSYNESVYPRAVCVDDYVCWFHKDFRLQANIL